jgi:uncharacterized protein DUF998
MSNGETAAGVVCLGATAVAVGALVVLHLLPTGLSPMHNAVSQYGITRYRLGYRVQTIGFAVAGAAAAVGLAEAAPGRGRVVLVLLGVFAVSRLAISWFPMDAPGSEERTSDGRTHIVLAVATFLAIMVAAVRLPPIVRPIDGWNGTATSSAVIGWYLIAMLLGMASSRRLPARRSYFGLAERAVYLGIVAWLVVVGVTLL